MNIYGFGSDLINIDRIKKIIKRNDNFKKRIFTKKEILICEKKKNNYASYAKKFAGKEAFSKALGVGISKGLSFNEIEILNDSNGKPCINLKKKTKLVSQKIIKKKNFKLFITITDEYPFAFASVIISL
ncbi:holo-ACP synthase [Pelagibacteraceae bacterium]|jgi:holo-[acyl-carrier protein] synthase|nr:holo-ACP synthase [Pelagibacteraceae bacterium]|tara:strand:- start:9346 stop:9732 length:387 start_codon:yes stop_codon:yes gene_type:complete